MIERARALTAGLTVGTLPLIWFAVVASGGLNLRFAHVFGALTLGLVAFPGRSGRIDARSLGLAVFVAGLVVFGSAGNLAWFGAGYWQLSEVVRFCTNIAIGVGVVMVFTEVANTDDHVLSERLLTGIVAGVALASGWWLLALANTPIGLGGLMTAMLRGDTRAVLFDAHLPAIRDLFGQNVLLGARHGAVFGFVTVAAVTRIVLMSFDPARLHATRRLRSIATGLSWLSVAIAIVSLSRSVLVALAAGGLAWLVVERERLLWNPLAYGLAACSLVGALSTLASGFGERLFSDTDSLSSRQVNATDVLNAEWTLLGSARLPEGTDSPHNMIIEFAAAGGVPMLLAGVLIVAVTVLGTLTAARRHPAITMLAVIVFVRLLSAARGSLDTAAVLALLLFVAADGQRRSLRTPRWQPAERPVVDFIPA